jgi:hypothetical protein
MVRTMAKVNYKEITEAYKSGDKKTAKELINKMNADTTAKKARIAAQIKAGTWK